MSQLPDLEDLLAELAFRCPQIAPAVARVNPRWDPTIPTAGVAPNGDIRINPNLAPIALQVLAHEVMHLVGLHYIDMPKPAFDPMFANIAQDMWLNSILQDLMPRVEWPKDWFYATGAQRDMTAREIYAEIYKKVQKVKGDQVGRGCGVEGNGDDEGKGQGDDPNGQNPVDPGVAAGVLAGIGSILPRVQKILVPPPPQSSIPEVLREAMAAGAGHTHKRASFTRLGRRSTPDVPRRGKITRGPCLVVIVDVSGSMYGHLARIREECVFLARHAKIHLILHDCSVLFSGRVGVDDMGKINVAGGTDFVEAFSEAKKVLADWNGPAALVHFTDGEVGNWPGPPVQIPSYAAICGAPVAPAPWRTRHLPGTK